MEYGGEQAFYLASACDKASHAGGSLDLTACQYELFLRGPSTIGAIPTRSLGDYKTASNTQRDTFTRRIAKMQSREQHRYGSESGTRRRRHKRRGDSRARRSRTVPARGRGSRGLVDDLRTRRVDDKVKLRKGRQLPPKDMPLSPASSGERGPRIAVFRSGSRVGREQLRFTVSQVLAPTHVEYSERRARTTHRDVLRVTVTRIGDCADVIGVK